MSVGSTYWRDLFSQGRCSGYIIYPRFQRALQTFAGTAMEITFGRYLLTYIERLLEDSDTTQPDCNLGPCSILYITGEFEGRRDIEVFTSIGSMFLSVEKCSLRNYKYDSVMRHLRNRRIGREGETIQL